MRTSTTPFITALLSLSPLVLGVSQLAVCHMINQLKLPLIFAPLFVQPRHVSTTFTAGQLADLDFPPNAQLISPSSFAVLDKVQPSSVKNGSTAFLPPGTNPESLLAKPFHIYNEDFLKIIGNSPSSKLIATDSTLAFHEAAVCQ